MASIEKILTAMRANPKNVRYADLHKVCEHYFGPPRTTGDPTPCSAPRGPATPA